MLVCYAERADDDGCNSFPSHDTVASMVHASVDTVKKKVRAMESRGILARGDQSVAAYIRADRRPVVYDLMIPLSWFSNLDRIQEYRAALGRPPLSARSRPDLGGSPERVRRADFGVPRKAADGGASSTVVLQAPSCLEHGGASSPSTGVLQVLHGGASSTTTLPSNTPQEHSPTPPRATRAMTTHNDSTPKRQPATPRRKPTRVPEDFTPTPTMIDWARRECPTVGRRDHDKFMDYFRAAPDRIGMKKDWEATWRNWMRKTHDEGTGAGGYGRGTQPQAQRQPSKAELRAATAMESAARLQQRLTGTPMSGNVIQMEIER